MLKLERHSLFLTFKLIEFKIDIDWVKQFQLTIDILHMSFYMHVALLFQVRVMVGTLYLIIMALATVTDTICAYFSDSCSNRKDCKKS